MDKKLIQRLYLMLVGSMPDYNIPLVCYLAQTADGKNILIDTGLPEVVPPEETEMVNGIDVIQQLRTLGLAPTDIDIIISTHYDVDHAGRHASFPNAQFYVQRSHHIDAATNPRFAGIKPQWDLPSERIHLLDGDHEVVPGLELIETSGHVIGHQSAIVRLQKTGSVLLTIDAVPFADGFTRELKTDDDNPDAEQIHASTVKMLDLVEREKIAMVVFGHDPAQWDTLKKAPDYYE